MRWNWWYDMKIYLDFRYLVWDVIDKDKGMRWAVVRLGDASKPEGYHDHHNHHPHHHHPQRNRKSDLNSQWEHKNSIHYFVRMFCDHSKMFLGQSNSLTASLFLFNSHFGAFFEWASMRNCEACYHRGSPLNSVEIKIFWERGHLCLYILLFRCPLWSALSWSVEMK